MIIMLKEREKPFMWETVSALVPTHQEITFGWDPLFLPSPVRLRGSSSMHAPRSCADAAPRSFVPSPHTTATLRHRSTFCSQAMVRRAWCWALLFAPAYICSIGPFVLSSATLYVDARTCFSFLYLHLHASYLDACRTWLKFFLWCMCSLIFWLIFSLHRNTVETMYCEG